jgi:hypothetical protein
VGAAVGFRFGSTVDPGKARNVALALQGCFFTFVGASASIGGEPVFGGPALLTGLLQLTALTLFLAGRGKQGKAWSVVPIGLTWGAAAAFSTVFILTLAKLGIGSFASALAFSGPPVLTAMLTQNAEPVTEEAPAAPQIDDGPNE